MNSSSIRSSFTDFFASRDHRKVASAPLVPHGDPTLLFTNAGMVQFKDSFLGTVEPPAPRVATVQKCLRVSGKHNDLENVGPSPRHHTFFEMLGNFSFGDYFKAEAIEMAWQLVTGEWGLPVDRLFATVFEEDDEAEKLWKQLSTLPAERILRCGAKDNFWAMGDTGPCGPCSEIFVDTQPDQDPIDFAVGSENGRYLEIWNLVFMQFDRGADGKKVPLPNPSIDTGAGLERLAAVLQGVESNYDSDLFRPIIDAAAELAQTSYGADPDRDVSLRVIADHLRAVGFLLADGVVPSSEGRGYVLRRILRRASRHGMGLGLERPFLHRLLPIVGEIAGSEYPEILGAERASQATIEAEEDKFLATVAAGSRQVQQLIEAARRQDRQEIGGGEIFRLYDTYGLPLEVIREIAEEEQMTLDLAGFENELAQQRQRSRAATSGSAALQKLVREELRGLEEVSATQFHGYRELEGDARIVGLLKTTADSVTKADRLQAGETAVILLDSTPFYAQGGGQVGDTGSIQTKNGAATVTDTLRESDWWLHFVRVEKGTLALGDTVRARVDRERRLAIQRNHTATHLLHASLRHVLGEGVRQAGSLVAPDRLRFDFTASGPMTREQIQGVEELVSRWIVTATSTKITDQRDLKEALAAGAMALFGEKYGDTVRTVETDPLTLNGDEAGTVNSLELCGGCHVTNLGEIGPFVVLSEKGIASGVRRIEALTGSEAWNYQRGVREVVEIVSEQLDGIESDRIAGEVERLIDSRRDLEQELSQAKLKRLSEVDDEGVSAVQGVSVLAREVPPAKGGELRTLADVLRARLGSGVVALGTREGNKASILVAVTDDLTDRLHAGNLVREIAAHVGGKGGGKGDFAQAGGREPEGLSKALAALSDAVEQQLETSS